MSRVPPANAHTRGFSLIEVMVAMTIGLLLLAGLYQMFLTNKVTYRTQQALARLQENTRYVVHTLTRDLRMAGYAGCRPAKAMYINVVADGLPDEGFADDGFVAIGGVNHAGGTSDSLTVRGATGTAARLTKNMDKANSHVYIETNPDNIETGDLAYIADCATADIFRVSNPVTVTGDGSFMIKHNPNKNTTKELSKAYTQRARLYTFEATTYFVAPSESAKLADGSFAPALWRELDGEDAELVQGVQNMQIQYGVNTDDDALHSADDYVTANSVAADWDNVVSVRVALLMQSLEAVGDTPDNDTRYTLLDQTVGPFGDRYLRRVVTFTVALRSRVH